LEDFALHHHRQLWAAISSLEEDNLGATRQDGAGRLEAINRGLDPGHELLDLDLPGLLADQLLVEQSELLNRLTPLLEPNEVQRLSLAQPLLQLRGTTAALERQRSLKRCRHLLDAWSSQRLETLERCIAILLAEGQPGAAGPPVLPHRLIGRSLAPHQKTWRHPLARPWARLTPRGRIQAPISSRPRTWV
jgi:DNA primase